MALMVSSLINVAHMTPLAEWGSFWLPPQASTIAQPVDWLFYFVYWICVFFFLLILVLLVGFDGSTATARGTTPATPPSTTPRWS